MSQSSSPSSKTLSFSPSGSRSRKVSSKSIFSETYEEVLEEDVAELRAKEQAIMNLNDQIIATARLNYAMNSDMDMTRNQIRRLKLELAEREEEFEERKEGVDGHLENYELASRSLQRATSAYDAVKQQIDTMKEQVAQLLKELQDTYKEGLIDNSSLIRDVKMREVEVAKLKANVEAKRKVVRSFGKVKADSEKKLQDLSKAENDLNARKHRLADKMKELDAKDDRLTKFLADPVYPITTEFADAEKQDALLRELDQRMAKDDLVDVQAVNSAASKDAGNLKQANDKRKEAILKKKDSMRLVRTRNNTFSFSRATPSVTRYRSSTATAAQNTPQKLQKLATVMAHDIFAKIAQTEINADERNKDSDQLEEENRKRRIPVEEEWHAKMKKIEELSREMTERETIGFSVASAEKDRDEAKRHEMELSFDLTKLKRTLDIRAMDKERNVTREAELQIHRSRTTEKEQDIKKREETLLRRRRELDALQSEVEKAEADATEYEAQVNDIQKESVDLEKKFVAKAAEVNRLTEEISACQ